MGGKTLECFHYQLCKEARQKERLLTFLNGDVCGEVVTDECVVTCGGIEGDKVSLIELK